MCLSKDRLESNMIPRFFAELTGLMNVLFGSWRCGCWSLDNCFGRPMMRNSVLDGFNVRNLEAIHCDTAFMVTWRLSRADVDAHGEKEMNSWVSSAYKYGQPVTVLDRQTSGL